MTTAICLQQVLPDVRFVGCDDISVSQVQADSRLVSPGDTFIAIRGTHSDGHDFIADAISRGAVAVVLERHTENLPVPSCIVPCTATAYAKLSMLAAVGPQPPVTLAGITGTNGKTTTAWMLRSILNAARLQTGLVGTIETSDGVDCQPSRMTTPSADVLARHMQQMIRQQTTHCVLEVSSHALIQKRCAGMQFAAAAITNITQDHLDYHQNISAYQTAKSRIADLLHTDAPLLLNLDDERSRALVDEFSGRLPLVTYSLDHADAELRATVLSQSHRSQRFRLQLAQGDSEVRLRLIGRHNVANGLAAAGIAEQLGIRLSDIVSGLEAVRSIPGRLERVDEGQSFQVLVDFAHTPDALQRSIEAIRGFVPGRLICVVGAGGNRDVSKRGLMGGVASAADLCFVTSDNPRNEDPLKIMQDIQSGFRANTKYQLNVDRRLAISNAFAAAEPGDVVLLAGKGHETTQEVNGRKLIFDDRSVARELLRADMTGSISDLQPIFSIPKSA